MVIKITVNETLTAKLDKLQSEIFSGRLMKNVGEIAEVIYQDKVWSTEGGLTGQQWGALKPSTEKDKSRKGYGSKPILQRTGKLKKSTNVSIQQKKVTVQNKSPYFKFHQEGTSKMIARPILRVNDQVEKTIEGVVNAYVKRILR
jgi:phage gpG-like protein